MKKSILLWQIIGIISIFILGALWHFLYNWSGYSTFVGLIAPINESTWEHLKILLFPFLIFALTEYKYIKNRAHNFVTAIAFSIITSMIVLIIIFYAYTSLLGHNQLIIDILSLLISIAIGEFVGYKILVSQNFPKWVSMASLLILMLIIFLFMIFTINPPHLPIFRDPHTGNYGL